MVGLSSLWPAGLSQWRLDAHKFKSKKSCPLPLENGYKGGVGQVPYDAKTFSTDKRVLIKFETRKNMPTQDKMGTDCEDSISW